MTAPTDVAAPVEEHNRFAGQGSVLLDIGGDVGALIVHAPAAMVGVEIEIRPAGTDSDGGQRAHSHDNLDGSHAHDHHHGSHTHDHDHGAGGGHSHHPHVAVVARPTANGPAYTAVFGELTEGSYELYRKLGGPVELTATVIGAEVVELAWPT